VDVAKNLNKGDVVLVKASRSEKLELLADAISAQWLSGLQEGDGE
jgi:UDP-N-acetylmuramoyl-tripeptide--D-alanyl-D-alanine ligase